MVMLFDGPSGPRFDESKRPKVGVGVIAFVDGPREAEDDLRYIIGRKKSGNRAGVYAFPGGHVEFGESLNETAAREFFEETGIDMNPEDFTFGELVQEVNAQGNHYLTFFMNVTIPEDKMAKLSNPESYKQEDWELLTTEQIAALGDNLDRASHLVWVGGSNPKLREFGSIDVFKTVIRGS